MPTVRAPPGRFSTTTGWPRILAISGATRRAMRSLALPAGCGTMRRIGRSGYSARLGAATRNVAAPMTATASRSCFRLRRQLTADLAALVFVAVHVDVRVAGLVRRHLRGVQLGAGGHGVGIAILGEGHDHRTVRALGALVDV